MVRILMNEIDSNAWCSFSQVVQNFLRHHKGENFIELVEHMLSNVLDRNMSIKFRYLYNHLDRFPENLHDFSKKGGHQDI